MQCSRVFIKGSKGGVRMPRLEGDTISWMLVGLLGILGLFLGYCVFLGIKAFCMWLQVLL